MSSKSTNVTWHAGQVGRDQREQARGHRGAVLWFTGLSGSGKSTLAVAAEKALFDRKCATYILDGDNVRHGLNGDLGFSPTDRTENIRRIGEVAKLFADAGCLVLTAFISPYRDDRDLVREIMPGDSDFLEIHVSCPLETCESRDPKGLYKKARAGEIPEFTGISAPYEEPLKPELVIQTGEHGIDECAGQVVEYLRENGYLNVD